MARNDHQQRTVRRYLLKQLPDAEQRAFELRLLTEDESFAELEIVEDELIDDYVADELSRKERTRFKEHFLTTPARKDKLRSAQAMKRYLDNIAPDPQPKPGTFSRFWKSRQTFFSTPITVAISMLIIAGIGLATWRVVFYKSDLEKGLIALNEAFRQERLVEVRVSSIDYAPYEKTRSNEAKRVNTLELNRAQVYLLQAEQQSRDAASYHALGKLYLLQREPNKAIEFLERAVKSDTNNAQIYADLGAAFLEKARLELERNGSGGEGKPLEDFGRSLENLKRALEIDPDLLEPLFNRALVHSYQGLTEAAKADWHAYLERDANSKWAAEARDRLKLLEDAQSRNSQNSDAFETFMRAYRAGDDAAAWEVYRSNHSSSGNAITNELIERFLAENATTASKSDNLRALAYLGQLELRQTNDPYTSDLARIYSSVTSQTRLLLATARQEVTKGRPLLGQSRIDEASRYFESARSAFERARDVPELLAVETTMAHGAVLQPNLTQGQKLLARIIPACESKGYKWLLAEALGLRAHIQTNLNNYSEAIGDANRALQIFQELKDVRNTLGAFFQLAGLYLFLNDSETSFAFLRRAMALAQADGVSRMQLWGVHIATSLNLTALRLYRAAFDYQNEALQLALQSGQPLYISRSYQFVGMTYGLLQQFDLASTSLRKAYEQGRPLAHERNGQNMMASASLRLGDLYRRSGDQANALAAYDESLRLYEGLEFNHYSYLVHKGRFLSYLAQNNDALASQELLTVFRLFNEYREKILAERQSTFFFDREQDTCDLAIDFTYFRLGDRNRAFDYSEICRARSLRELMRRGAEVTSGPGGLDLRSKPGAPEEDALPLNALEISRQLPEEVQLVEFALLEKKIVIWLITRSGVFPTSVDIDAAKLTDLVVSTVGQIRKRDEKAAAEGLKSLYSQLIEPIRGQLDANKVICFVPDKILHYVPFAALISNSSGHYLAQDYGVMVSPSAAILIDSSTKAKAWPAGQEERLLAVGNPKFERAPNSRLLDLPEAEREVEGIIRDYPLHNVLLKHQATRASVIDQLIRANVAHFAAHYEIDPRSTLSSKLLLAPGPGDRAHAQPAGLDAGSIYQMNLANTKLVVLAACQTGIEQQFGGEGPIGFARSFLVAGVPVVVASLWPVDSDATAELMIAFHHARRSERRSTTAALKQAQQEVMAREKYRSPFYWSGFTVIGGYSHY